MKRRIFFRRLFGGLGAAAATPLVGATNRTVLIQESSNPHDADAVAVYFHEEMLGYVPRAENGAVAQMLDRGEGLEARISKLSLEEDPLERIRITISLN